MRFTNRQTGLAGGSVVSTRLPKPVLAYIDAHLDDDRRNRSDFLCDAAIRLVLAEDPGWEIPEEETDGTQG